MKKNYETIIDENVRTAEEGDLLKMDEENIKPSEREAPLKNEEENDINQDNDVISISTEKKILAGKYIAFMCKYVKNQLYLHSFISQYMEGDPNPKVYYGYDAFFIVPDRVIEEIGKTVNITCNAAFRREYARVYKEWYGKDLALDQFPDFALVHVKEGSIEDAVKNLCETIEANMDLIDKSMETAEKNHELIFSGYYYYNGEWYENNKLHSRDIYTVVSSPSMNARLDKMFHYKIDRLTLKSAPYDYPMHHVSPEDVKEAISQLEAYNMV